MKKDELPNTVARDEGEDDPPVGWVCPLCGRGVAPWVERCDCWQEDKRPRTGPSETKGS